jgi:hypothetical protein
MVPRVFTPLEATRALPFVRRIVADILERGRELRGLWERAELTASHEQRAEALAHDLEGLFAELDSVGCSFRSPDFSLGLIDFPGLIDGQMVHLCWRSDEPSLAYYHEPQAGFAGRKPIPAELLEPAPTPSSEARP